MTTNAKRKLVKDYDKIQKEKQQWFKARPLDQDIMKWDAILFGPEDTIWDGGCFRLTFTFSEEYPNKPPTVQFLTTLFHPNVYNDGKICMDTLQNKWSSLYDVSSIMTAIVSLLNDPNPDSPANKEAAVLFTNDRKEYEKRVREIVEQSWRYQ